MRPRILLLAISLFGFVVAKANTDPDPGTEKRKVAEINGIVMNADNKKPLKDVNVTAYLGNKKEKEKTISSDQDGSYAFDELRPGVYKFVFEKAGFKRVTKERVVIRTDETFQLNIEMIEYNDSDLMPSPFHF